MTKTWCKVALLILATAIPLMSTGCGMVGGFVGSRIAGTMVSQAATPLARAAFEQVGKQVGRQVGQHLQHEMLDQAKNSRRANEQATCGAPSATPLNAVSPSKSETSGSPVVSRSLSYDQLLLARARGASKANRANINLAGPAIGSTPYYLSYSVELPVSALEGADFLWMDNGVWMGDEPRGAKIIESPGLHRISVLVITQSNEEYRGAASVQVQNCKTSSQLTDLAMLRN